MSHSLTIGNRVGNDLLDVLCFSLKVKDVRLPQNLQRAMAAEAEASREARAKVKNLATF